jgi:PHP domain-containing protein
LGVETYNATALDRESNQQAEALAAECPGIAQVGNSDAHIAQAIGLGATEFPGCTAADLLEALWIGATDVRRGTELSSARMLSTWALNYIISTPARVTVAYPQRM